MKFNIFSIFLSIELLFLERYNTTHYHEYFPAALVIYRDDEDTRRININVLYSGNSLHSLAATVNLISNFELQYFMTNGANRIKTTNAPMHRYFFFDIFIEFYLNCCEFFYQLFYEFFYIIFYQSIFLFFKFKFYSSPN